MKTCDKHHGEIQYDGMIYLECPLCKMTDYDEIMEDNCDKETHIDFLEIVMDRAVGDIQDIMDTVDDMDVAEDKLKDIQYNLENY